MASYQVKKQKDLSVREKSILVTQVQTNWNLICEEIIRWWELFGKQRGLVAIPAGLRTYG